MSATLALKHARASDLSLVLCAFLSSSGEKGDERNHSDGHPETSHRFSVGIRETEDDLEMYFGMSSKTRIVSLDLMYRIILWVGGHPVMTTRYRSHKDNAFSSQGYPNPY